MKQRRNMQLSQVWLSEMTTGDYAAMVSLLAETAGVTLRTADSYENTQTYLDRNPGLSFLAKTGADEVIGMVMAGHDGRRGYVQHLLVKPAYRGQGIAKALVERCLDELAALGILKSHIFIREENATGEAFWQHLGWYRRDDVKMYSFNRSTDPNI